MDKRTMSFNGNGNGNGNGSHELNGNGHHIHAPKNGNGKHSNNGHGPKNGNVIDFPHQRVGEMDQSQLMTSPLVPEGYFVPKSRNVHPSKRMRELLASEPYLFGPGCYDPMTAQLCMYYGFKAVYFSGYSFAMGHVGSTDMDLYTSTEVADAARRTISA